MSNARTRLSPEARSAEIIDAASRLFSERGYRGTSVAAVAATIGITDAGVLHHFPTKRALLLAVLDNASARGTEQIRELTAEGGLAALIALGSWGEVMEATPHIMGLEIALSTEGLEAGSPLHDYFTDRYATLRRRLVRLFEQAIAAGEVRPDIDPAFEASAFLAHMDGIRLQWYFAKRFPLATSVRTYVDQLVERVAT